VTAGTAQGDWPGLLLAEALDWLAEDPDPDTRAELRALLEAGDVAAVSDRFAGRLAFGTAGLRGALGAGPNRMNRSVVIRTAAGLAAYLRARGGRGVVIGYDARHKSDLFARDSAEVLAGAGLRALLLPRALPTPVLAFAVRRLGCDAGVMVTASHNPPQDNGYKVYLGDGMQIVPPADGDIDAAIDEVGALAGVARSEAWTTVDDSLVAAYVSRAAAVARPGTPRELRVAYTPMHGVGGALLVETLTRAGFAAPTVVAAQAEPDPEFPTLAFPNPEEPGALDLALAAGEQAGADLVIANDPDADRCAAAVPTPAGWRLLHGDELGVLLGAYLLRRDATRTGVVAASVVSSSLLGKVAAARGVAYVETLTGFKWLARPGGLRYAYEEALGYCVDPDGVRDKDGISAAVLLAELAAGLRAEGRTLTDALDDLALEHGLHASGQLSLRVADLALIGAAMGRLRARPPSTLGGRDVEGVDDLADGLGGLPPTDALRLWLAGGGRAVIRPSGTEPKLKCYLEVVVAPGAAGGLQASRVQADLALAAIEADLVSCLGLPAPT